MHDVSLSMAGPADIGVTKYCMQMLSVLNNEMIISQWKEKYKELICVIYVEKYQFKNHQNISQIEIHTVCPWMCCFLYKIILKLSIFVKW